ncbi:MAG: hypothetical protein ICV66_07215 [Chitinophagaceae bacterium]|nr:hypothetical protein [Chitinophagaceae bacterium]
MKTFIYTFFVLISIYATLTLFAQQPKILRGIGNRRLPTGTGTTDTLQHRNRNEDSITLTYLFLDSTTNHYLDSSISDYTQRFPIRATYIYLGNPGAAAKSILFSPADRSGWDPGFHAFDIYKWHLNKARFFNTTRPYTELGYTLGSQTQQIIEVLHTQNIRPYWNASFQYRMINSPGFFKNQKTNHNNYLFTSWYQSWKKRYNNYIILLQNNLQSEENGGIKNDKDYLNDPIYEDRFSIPTHLGSNVGFERNFFSPGLSTGNRYKEFNALMRQQYDFGRKDSIVTDSTVVPLFYPRLRFEHTINYGSYKYEFRDFGNFQNGHLPDSAYYADNYNIHLTNDSLRFRDTWKEISNDFSVYQYPDLKNLHQFIKAGLTYQLLSSALRSSQTFYNLIAHGEYRNKTRNQKWYILAMGKLYLNGFNSGDYHAFISLQSLLGRKFGSLQLGFENINRSPSFLFNYRSNFYLDEPKSFSKENTSHFFVSAQQSLVKLQLGADYYVIANYLYLKDFYKLQQDEAFTLLRINALKTFKLNRNWNIYSEAYVQQKAGNVNLNIPLFFTRNRMAFEGNFFENLFLSTGFEVRYHTPYRADNYSPVLGQFFYQDSARISNNPEVSAFFNFRIRSFKAFVRAENLNSVNFSDGFNFTNNNLAAPGYAYPGLVLRLSIYWSFVN